MIKWEMVIGHSRLGCWGGGRCMIQDARERGPALSFCAVGLGFGDVGGAQVILALRVSG